MAPAGSAGACACPSPVDSTPEVGREGADGPGEYTLGLQGAPTSPPPADADASPPARRGSRSTSGRAAKKKAKKKAAKKKAKKKKAAKKKATKKRAAKRKATKAAKAPAAPTRGVDALTGLPAGEAARAAWEGALQEARGRGTPASLVLFDLDGFDAQVQALGLERADQALKEVAKRLRGALSDASFLGRLGGDCFGVVLPGVPVEAALGLSEAARTAVARRPVRVGRGPTRRDVEAVLSAGIVGLDRDGGTLDELLVQAHAALWRAKTLGGNRSGLPVVERKQLKTSYYEQSQAERLKRLAARVGIKESVLLREALEDLLLKHKSRRELAP
ncbi:MAG: diguanylate cyclase [Planctomycetota bacterium]